jgi:DNA invertase Pin-like site-specific DNA recombinase
MNSSIPLKQRPTRRCAIYTRKSSERGLQQDFNSLQAQNAICSAYIQSQQHKGWVPLKKIYEDAAQSGATLDRPAMRELMADVEMGRIDVVVVYKLDRLSRSLLDFVRLLDAFERYGVTFACITQNFDTADSLGRLVMNVLLTFAQFEREMTGDRVRDKKRAMGLKGLWSGGRPPLGYDLVDKRLVIVPREAAIIRYIYSQYLECGNLTAVARECQAKGFRSKTWMPRTGVLQLGVPLRPACVRGILMNPIYAGYLSVSGALHRGIHQAIVSEQHWQQVASLREKQIMLRAKDAPREVLDGLMYDCFGRSMTANRLRKPGKLHVYYRSNQNDWGKSHSVRRMSARSVDAESLVTSALQNLLSDREKLRSLLLDLGRYGPELGQACRKGPIASRRLEAISRDQLRSVVHGLVVRIEVSRERFKIVTRATAIEDYLNWDFVGLFRPRAVNNPQSPTHLIDIPCAGSIRLERYVRLPITARKAQTYRINKRLREAIVEARNVWAMIEDNRDLSPTEIATRYNCSLSHMMRLLRLNYLAPDIVTAIMDGAQPRELTRRGLLDANLPLDWELQRKMFGFEDQPPMRTTEKPY